MIGRITLRATAYVKTANPLIFCHLPHGCGRCASGDGFMAYRRSGGYTSRPLWARGWGLSRLLLSLRRVREKAKSGDHFAGSDVQGVNEHFEPFFTKSLTSDLEQPEGLAYQGKAHGWAL